MFTKYNAKMNEGHIPKPEWNIVKVDILYECNVEKYM